MPLHTPFIETEQQIKIKKQSKKKKNHCTDHYVTLVLTLAPKKEKNAGHQKNVEFSVSNSAGNILDLFHTLASDLSLSLSLFSLGGFVGV